MSRQELLKEAWLGGRQGNMSGQTQARAWALREVWKDEHGEKTYGMLTHIASKLYTITPPRKKKEHPSSSALAQLFDKMDSDKEWSPGKRDQCETQQNACQNMPPKPSKTKPSTSPNPAKFKENKSAATKTRKVKKTRTPLNDCKALGGHFGCPRPPKRGPRGSQRLPK